MAGGLDKACTEGFAWQGEPSGNEITLGSLKAYHASPTHAGKHPHSAVLFVTDVFGFDARNNRLAADAIAQRTGIHVYVPDLLQGDVFTMEGRTEFLARHGPQQTEPMLDDVIKGIKAKHGRDACKLGAVGFCWGGRYSLRLGAQGKVAAAVACHPSLVEPQADLDGAKAPVLLLLAAGDPAFSGTRKDEAEAIIKKAGVQMQVKEYQGVKHGFTVRCDEGDEVACKARDDASVRTSEWFAKHLL